MLRYRHRLADGGTPACAVLAVERQPRDPLWEGLCAELEVVLVWPEVLDERITGRLDAR